MRPVPRLGLVSWLMAAVVPGCSSPGQEVDRTARPWTATARSTSEALAVNAVPRVYAVQVLQAALETKRRLKQQPEWHALHGNTRIALGVFTSIGGFLEVGAIATTAQAGAAFGFELIWAVQPGTVCVIFLVEMSGRLAAVSRHTIKDALRSASANILFASPGPRSKRSG